MNLVQLTEPSLTTESDTRKRAEDLRAKRAPFVVATVVHAERPTAARPGSTAIVLDDGTISGFVGGTCAEASVRLQALKALETGQPVLLKIAPDPASQDESSSEPGVVVARNPCLSGGRLEIFLDPVLPPPLLGVHGDSPIAVALLRMASQVGYAALASSNMAAGAGEPAYDGVAAVVVASHGRDELTHLRAALDSGVAYIGLVASPRRGRAVLEELALGELERKRIHTPAGLDIGARTPGEIALSILAEIVALRPLAAAELDSARRAMDASGSVSQGSALQGEGLDPVCGMAVAISEATLSASFEGSTYWFCGSGCRQAFMADPAGMLNK